MKFLKTTTAACILAAAPAFAADWTLDPASSVVSFGSIKNDFAGEAHVFSGLSGSVSSDGMVNVEIDLTSVNTNIEIRDERMGEHVFAGVTTAGLSAQVDMAALEGLGVGESMTMEVDGDLSFFGEDIPVFLDMFILRVSDSQVMASTNTATYLSTEDLGVDAGVDVLQELASLDSITRVSPVTLRFMFNVM
ncbi:YceI family protein [Yoonia sp. GPGPB17]|uniref:YceI family protein n=1 Tax=Yoonia sp. GPGPB17 TaxID=3026147 RepID=UPI0030C27CBE